MIEVKNLSKDYGQRRAISNLSFTVQKGDVVGFLGPNGAGKSTTMKIITGFMAPTSGQALVAGIDVFENPIEVKKRIGYLPETPPLYSDMFVRDYLQYVATLKQVPTAKIKQFVDSAIEKTHLEDVQKRLIQNLSKGFKQRVGIAQALVSDPEVLVLDEPTVGLDPKQVSEIRELILNLRGQHTIILSTHVLSEVQASCEKVIIINKGEIVLQDSIEHLAAMESGHARIQLRLAKDAPSFDQDVKAFGELLGTEKGQTNKHWVVDLKGGDENISEFSRFLIHKGYGLIEYSPVKMDLEDIFIKVTYGNGEDAGSQSARESSLKHN